MPCTPDFCDIHDYDVHPGSGWCRAVDTAHGRSQNKPRLDSQDGILAEAIFALLGYLESLEGGKSRHRPASPPVTQKPEPRKGGTPL